MILKNILAQSFRKARDFLGQDHSINLVLKLYKSQYKDVRVYNLPTSNEVAGSIVDDLDTMEVGRDIIVRKQEKREFIENQKKFTQENSLPN